MSLSDLEITYLVIAICSLILALISIITVVLTLRQNSKMIESTTRPYVTVYGAISNPGNPFFYLIIKNFGSSSAFISKFECSHDLLPLSYSSHHRPFEHLEGSLIAPSQSFKCAINLRQRDQGKPESIEIIIRYRTEDKEYSSKALINFDSYLELALPKNATQNAELKTISYSIQSLVEQNL